MNFQQSLATIPDTRANVSLSRLFFLFSFSLFTRPLRHTFPFCHALSHVLSLSLSTRFPFSIPPRSRSFHSFFSAFLTFRPSIPLSSSVSPCSNMAGRCPITRSSLPATVFPRAPLHDAKATKKRSSSSAATFLPPIFPLFPPRRGHQPLPLPSPRRFPSSHNVHAVPFSARTSHSTRGGIDPACDLNWETVPLLRDPFQQHPSREREKERESD